MAATVKGRPKPLAQFVPYSQPRAFFLTGSSSGTCGATKLKETPEKWCNYRPRPTSLLQGVQAFVSNIFENWRASLKWQRLKPYEKFAEMIDLGFARQ
jgi:hypothetical protein